MTDEKKPFAFLLNVMINDAACIGDSFRTKLRIKTLIRPTVKAMASFYSKKGRKEGLYTDRDSFASLAMLTRRSTLRYGKQNDEGMTANGLGF